VSVVNFGHIGVILGGTGGDIIQGDVLTGNREGNLVVNAGADGNTSGGTSNSARIQITGTDVINNFFSIVLGSNNNVVPNVVTDGINIRGSNNTIGGTTVAVRNVVGGPTGNTGVNVAGSGNIVQGNFIGTDITGTQPAPFNDLETGLAVSGSNNLIGGTAAG